MVPARHPWRTFVVGVQGCSGSGKTSLAESLAFALAPRACVMSLDAYYRADVGHASEFESAALFDWERVKCELDAKGEGGWRFVIVEGIVLLADKGVAAALDAVVELHVSDGGLARARRLARDVGDTSPFNTVAYFDEHVWPAHLAYRRAHADAVPDTPRLVLDAAQPARDTLRQAAEFIRAIHQRRAAHDEDAHARHATSTGGASQ